MFPKVTPNGAQNWSPRLPKMSQNPLFSLCVRSSGLPKGGPFRGHFWCHFRVPLFRKVSIFLLRASILQYELDFTPKGGGVFLIIVMSSMAATPTDSSLSLPIEGTAPSDDRVSIAVLQQLAEQARELRLLKDGPGADALISELQRLGRDAAIDEDILTGRSLNQGA